MIDISFLSSFITLFELNYIWFSAISLFLSALVMFYTHNGLSFTFVFSIMTFLGFVNGYYPMWYFAFIILLMLTLAKVNSGNYRISDVLRI